MQKRTLLLIGFFVALLTFVVFSPALQYPFVNWDDNIYLYQNPRFHPLTFDNLISFFTKPYFHSWTPIAMLSHGADVALWGFNPFGHHLSSLILHSINAGLVFWLALRLISAFGKKRNSDNQQGLLPSSVVLGSVAAALVFSLHPLRVESVAWVSDRKDLLCAFFMLLTSLAYLKRREEPRKNRASLLFLLLMYIFALGSKSTAMMLPFAFILLDITFYNRRFLGSLIEMSPLILLAAGAGLMAKFAAPDFDSDFVVGERTAAQLLSFPFAAVLFYVTKLLLPLDLSPVYHTNAFLPAASGLLVFLSPIAIIAAAVFCVWEFRRGRSYWLIAVGAFVLFLLPTFLGVLSGIQPVADRYTYFASISLCLLAGGGVERLLRSFGGRTLGLRRGVTLGVCVACILLLSYNTLHQMKIWSDPVTLWTYVIQRAPFPVAHNNLGMIYVEKGMHEEAIASLKRAIGLRPDYGEALCNLGIAYNKMGDVQRAILTYKEAIRLQPDHLDSYINLGTEYLNKGFVDSAVNIYRDALSVDSNFAPAYYNTALALMKQQRYAEAIVEHKKALALVPTDADAWYNLGVAYENVSKIGEGIDAYTKAIEFRREYLDAYINLGNLHAARGEPDKALETFGSAIRVNPQSADVFYNLGYVLYGIGEIDKAINSFEVAIRNDSSYAQAYHNLGVIYGQRGDSSRAASFLQQGARLGFEQSRQLLQQKGINW